MATTGERTSKIHSEKIASVFHQYADREFVFVEPGGNFGDRLIFKGAQKIAKQQKISYDSVTFEEFKLQNCNPEQIIYIHGSGGYNPWWSGRPIKAFEKAVCEHRGICILGPTTFDTDPSFLEKNLKSFLHKRRDQKVVITAREWVSFNALKKLLPGWVELIHDHDTSLNLGKDDLSVSSPDEGYTFYAIRNDKEKVQFDHISDARRQPGSAFKPFVFLTALSLPGKFSGSHMLFLSARLGFFLMIWFLVGIYILPSALSKVRNFLSNEIMLVVSIGLCEARRPVRGACIRTDTPHARQR